MLREILIKTKIPIVSESGIQRISMDIGLEISRQTPTFRNIFA